jgi:hypothetical protein
VGFHGSQFVDLKSSDAPPTLSFKFQSQIFILADTPLHAKKPKSIHMTICEWNPKPKSEVGGRRRQQHEDSGLIFFQPRITTTQDSTHPIKESEKGRI